MTIHATTDLPTVETEAAPQTKGTDLRWDPVYLRGEKIMLAQFPEGALKELVQEICSPHRQWRRKAACSGLGPEQFYPAGGEEYSGVLAARIGPRVCHECPVRISCLAEGLGERHGIWGGLSIKQRSAVKKMLSVMIGSPVEPPASTATYALWAEQW